MNGERVPIVILFKPGVQELAAKGYVKLQADLAVSLVGIAVADSAPAPVLKTTADFVAFLKSTPSIAYTERGPSGVYMAQLIEKLGLTEIMKAKATVVNGPLAAPLIRAGKVAAAMQQISELKMAGARNIVPLPDEIQLRSIITVAVLENRTPGAVAARIVDVLTSHEAAAAYERAGVAALFGSSN